MRDNDDFLFDVARDDPGSEVQPLLAAVERIRGTRVLCIGDAMLDHYVYGRVERVSPEAPVPVLRVQRDTSVLGGAGNVVRNLVALGAEVVFVSVIGSDEAGRELLRLLAEIPGVEVHLLSEPGRPTTVKTRYVAGAQHLVRADRESVAPISDTTRADLLRLVDDAVGKVGVVVLSDYGKGVLTGGVAEHTIDRARAASRAVVVDPKGTDYRHYTGATLLKPNRIELAAATGMPVSTNVEVTAAATWLIETYDFGAVLVSLSKSGMLLVPAGGGEVAHFPAEALELFDVSGAGDTAVATVAAAMAAGVDLSTGSRLANAAAGLVVEKIGTAVASSEELVSALQHGRRGPERKVAPLSRALEIIEGWRTRGLKVGLTDGCFELLHPGHAYMLAKARATCDRLVVAIEDDAMGARQSERRPLRGEHERALVVASMGCVDLVTIFGGDTPCGLVEAIRPDVFVKGAGHASDGAEIVRSYGGRVVLVPRLPGYNSADVLGRLGEDAPAASA